MTRSVTHDHYEILSLPFTGTSAGFSKQQLKLAYHKALLKHHPDKASSVASDIASNPSTTISTPTSTNRIYTIDDITIAYKTLSDPTLRAEYDGALRLDRSRLAEREKTATVFHTGLEIVDLEDLICEEDGDSHGDTGEPTYLWYRGCRCGDDRGFMLVEEDLEREADHGEIVVGCGGCSLWMKVLFAVAGEDNGT
ncbi:Diphthamide biosynthesis protein 4 [Aspergillus nanangensis]|uniref:Diphthamide biosynthesis protein 4 n=1 Tax=Aspergillus nanangensis TaxID=2582783 RepID=A0AAD4CH55_ASPNN|nr:Diphthamide biosynthesis protein 4 [Aspergillus nanangensis]